MTIQSFYPIFEHGQVLTSAQLNTMVDYLEQQDRLSRRTLSGVGVVCGFDLDRTGTRVEISRGVAVTSEGFLITSEAHSYDRVRSYQVPVPTAEEATPEDIAEAQYPFLFADDGTQIPVLELVDTDFVAAPGEDDPRAITNADLNGGVVMLFLEAERASPKSCDVNDCSDKGAERRFALRRLLLSRAQAEAIIAQEAGIAARPVDRGRHPRLDLPYLRIEKLALARVGVDNFGALIERTLVISQKLASQLPQALRDAHGAYGYLLDDMFAPGEDPFPDGYFGNVWGQLAQNIFLVQYFYDYMRDVGMAYNEFVETAARFETECMPNPARFPRHVLLGDVTDAPDAFAIDFATPADVLAFSPQSATSGAGLGVRPALRRTHFIPSPAHESTDLEDLRALFLRMHLLALNFDLNDRLTAPIRITPSRDDAAPLSERAMPFYYAFDQGSDLFRNWSPRKTRANLLNTVYAYRFNPPDANHPLAFRIDDQDFYRIEGIVGKPLGSAMAELIAWKRELGLSFAIEPVYMRLSTGADDRDGSALDTAALAALLEVLRKLLLCRMSDFDALLLTLLRTLFALIVFIVRAIATALANLQTPPPPAPQPSDTAADNVTLRPGAMLNFDPVVSARFISNLNPEEQAQLKQEAYLIQSQLKGRTLVRGDALKLAVPEVQSESIGAVYQAVQDDAAGGNLFDRTQQFVQRAGGDEEDTQIVYAQVAMLDQGDQMMRVLNVGRTADLDFAALETAYSGFSRASRNYAQIVGAMPEKVSTPPEETAQIASAADTIASEGTAFAVSNLRDEIGRVLINLLNSLTLDGFAQRHPGLEHSAGVPKGGTFVLAYVGRVELEQHLRTISEKFSARSQSVANILGNDTVVNIQNALQELQKSVGGRTPEPLDNYVVLADFCLPYKCCDSDCSDVELSESILADPFGRDFSPEPMAVPPVTGQSPAVPSIPRGPDDFIAPRPVVVVNRAFENRPVVDVRAFERPIGIDALLRDRLTPGGIVTPTPGGIVAPTPGGIVTPTPGGIVTPAPGGIVTPTPREPITPVPREPVARDVGVIAGTVVMARGNRDIPVPGAEVIVELEDGSQMTETTNRSGAFRMEVPAGDMRIRATAGTLSGRRRGITLDATEEREMTLRITALR